MNNHLHQANLNNERTLSIDITHDPLTTKVPVEITAHIFQCYVKLHHKHGNLAEAPTFGFNEIPVGTPLRLGAVSRRWREIAWDTPALWAMLVADLLSSGHAHGPQLVKEWLERTADLSVHVALRLHVDAHRRHRARTLVLKGQRKRDAEAIVRIINKHWSKLKSIDLRDTPWKLAVQFNSNAPSALENLCVGGFGNDDLEQGGYKLFRQTLHKPSPTGLSLLSTIPPTLLNIDWSNLTTLDIDDLTRQTLFDIIELCARTVTNITLKAINDEDHLDIDEDWLPDSVINLPALIAISFMELGTQEGFAETLFDHITAPALRSIWYYGLEEDNEMPVDSMVSFIQRSSCKIVHFLLHDPSFFILDPDIDEDLYMSLLHEMPSLHMLDISLGAELSVEPLFSALAERDATTDRPTFLPHLRELTCITYPGFDWALFPEVWMATHPDGQRIGDADFKFAQICVAQARAKLTAQLTLRGPLDKEDYVEAEALMALMAIKGQIHAEISIHTESKRRDASVGHKFLQESFLHCFPKQTHPVHFEMLQAFRKEGII